MPRRPIQIEVTRIYTGAKSKQEIAEQLLDICRNDCIREKTRCKPHIAPDVEKNLSAAMNGTSSSNR